MKLHGKAHLAALSAAIVLLPSVVFGAVLVKGKVVNTEDLLNPVWNEAKAREAHRYTFREPVSSVPPDVRILRGHLTKELCLVLLSDQNAAPKPKPIHIVIEGGRTSAVTYVVADKQEIQFDNHDPTDHAIYGVSDDAKLTKGVMKPDATRSWTPPGPGTYELRDELAPSLRSWIVVEPRAAEAFFPNRKGEFELKLEPGTYKLRAYYSGKPVGEDLTIEVNPKPTAKPDEPFILKDPLKAGVDKKPPEGKDKKDEKADPKAPGAPGTDPKKIAPPGKGGG